MPAAVRAGELAGRKLLIQLEQETLLVCLVSCVTIGGLALTSFGAATHPLATTKNADSHCLSRVVLAVRDGDLREDRLEGGLQQSLRAFLGKEHVGIRIQTSCCAILVHEV